MWRQQDQRGAGIGAKPLHRLAFLQSGKRAVEQQQVGLLAVDVTIRVVEVTSDDDAVLLCLEIRAQEARHTGLAGGRDHDWSLTLERESFSRRRSSNEGCCALACEAAW